MNSPKTTFAKFLVELGKKLFAVMYFLVLGEWQVKVGKFIEDKKEPSEILKLGSAQPNLQSANDAVIKYVRQLRKDQ